MTEVLTSQDIQQEITAGLEAGLGDNLVAVVLFGSRARGEARAESDWDLLLIANGLPAGTLKRHFFVKRILPTGCRSTTSILAKSPQEFEARVPSLYLDI